MGNGLNPILDREVDMISIAGMGSYLISEILEEHREYLRNVKLMFLQANANNDHLRNIYLLMIGSSLMNRWLRMLGIYMR